MIFKKYGKYIPKSDKSITRYRDDIYDAESRYGDDREQRNIW